MNKKQPRLLTASIASLVVLTAKLGAQTSTWDGGGVLGGNVNWSIGTNWVGDVAPLNDGTAQITFAGVIDLNPNTDVAWSINRLTFASGAGAFTLGGSPITIGAGGINNLDDSVQTITNSLILSAPQTWTQNSATTPAGGLVVSGAVNNSGNLLTVSAGAGGNPVTISGAISGTGGLTKSGVGDLTLSGAAANTYTGTTTINSGRLILQKTASINALSGPVVVGDGSGTDILELGASNQIPAGSAVTINSSGVFDVGVAAETVNLLTINGGSVTIGTGTLNVATNLAMTGGTISSAAGGLFTLVANLVTNPDAASATIAGNLNLGSATRTFTVAEGAAADDLDVTASMSGTSGINKLGAGTLRLSGNNTFAGSLNVTAGTVAIGSNTAAGTSVVALSGGTLTSGTGGPFTLANAITLNGNSTVNDITLNGAVTLVGNRTLTVGSGTVALGGSIGGDVTAANFTKAGAGTLVLIGGTVNSYGGDVTVAQGTLTLAKNTGITPFAGNLIVGDGVGIDVVNLTAGNEQIPNSSNVTVNAGGAFNITGSGLTETISNLNVNAGGVVDLGTGILSVSGLQMTGNAAVGGAVGSALGLTGNVTTIAAGSGQATITAFTSLFGGERTFTIADGGAQFDLAVGSLINGTLIKDGPGGLLLQTGNAGLSFTLNEGLVGAAASSSFGGGTLTLNGGTIMPTVAGLTFQNPVNIGGDVEFAGSVLTTFNGPISLTVPNPALTISNTGLTVFSGPIGETAPGSSFTKAGAGVLRFTGNVANTYTGTTTVAAGTLILAKSSGTAAVPGNLVIGDGIGSDIVQLLQSHQIAESASVTVNSGATLDLGSAAEIIGSLSVAFDSTVNVSTGALTVGGGGLAISGGTISGSGSLNLLGDVNSPPSNVGIGNILPSVNLGGASRDFIVEDGAAAVELDISGALSNGTLVKGGNGILRFSGAPANAATLGISVFEGELRLAKTTANAAINGPLTIGDSVGGPNADIVRLQAPEQINSTAAAVITINASGLLDLNNFNDTIGGLTLAGGNVTTGSGTLTIVSGGNANITSLANPSTASISGNLALSNQQKTFTVGAAGIAVDLDIPAVISNGGIAKAGAGVLRLSGNNSFAGGLVINAGTVLLGSNTAAGTGGVISMVGGSLRADGGARTLANQLAVGGVATIDGTQNLTFTSQVTLSDIATLTKSGTGTLSLTGGVSLFGELRLSGGTLAIPGATINQPGALFTQNSFTTLTGGILINQGTFVYNGGVFDAVLQNEGNFFINLGFLAEDGFINFASVNVTSAGSLNANGSGIANEGSMTLTGGVLQFAASGPVVNNGEISGFGTIAGSGGFTNNAQVTVSDGNLTLDNSGTQTNAGNIEIPNSRQLRLSDPLGNTGTISLFGGTIAGTALLNNNAGGTVSGRGTIIAPLANNGGTFRAEGGTLNVTNVYEFRHYSPGERRRFRRRRHH